MRPSVCSFNFSTWSDTRMSARVTLATLGCLVAFLALSVPIAWAQSAGTPGSGDPFGGWGTVLSSSPLVVLLVYVFREMMAANRARELDQKEREKLAQEHEVRLEVMRGERDKEIAAALKELGTAVDRMTERCVHGANSGTGGRLSA